MRFAWALFACSLLAGCAVMQEPLPPPPTTAEVVAMARAGAGADAIIERMKASRAVYPLSASELARLRDDGVPDPVIDHMQQSYIEAVRRAEWRRLDAHYHFFYGPPFPYYPYYPWGWRRPFW